MNGDFRLFHLMLNIVILTISADPDRMPRSAASDLVLHCLPVSKSSFYR